MQIEIDIPRPYLTLAWIVGIGWAVVHFTGLGDALTAQTVPVPVSSSSSSMSVPAYDTAVRSVIAQHTGGDREQQTVPDGDAGRVSSIARAEEDIRIGRAEQEMLSRKADILRGQIRVLEGEQQSLGGKITPELADQFKASERILTALLQDQRRAEDFLRAAFEQMSAAQQAAGEFAVGTEGETAPQLLWPVTPFLGVSATFHDASYEERFGFRHDALDIPTAQGTPVLASADGIVKDVSDHGFGFNSVTIKHAGGLVTLYGHIEKFSVAVGQRVSAGEVIGLSGGRPGTPGAGLSTGPHVHFGVYTAGEAVNPQPLLPNILEQVRASQAQQEE